jgi:Family of unknown function (DUF6086)
VGWRVEYNNQTIWEPALVVGQLFLGELGALERLFACPSGIVDTGMDTMEIDPIQLQQFLERGFAVLDRTNSGPLLALVEGCFAITIALNHKITQTWPTVSVDFQSLVDRARTVFFPIPRTTLPPNPGPWSVVIPRSDLPGTR